MSYSTAKVIQRKDLGLNQKTGAAGLKLAIPSLQSLNQYVYQTSKVLWQINIYHIRRAPKIINVVINIGPST